MKKTMSNGIGIPTEIFKRKLGLSRILFLLFLGLFSCVEGLMRQNGLDPLIQANVSGGNYGVWDGAHGGIDGFYFLPPIVKEPSYNGEFDPGLAPVVEICNGTDCTSILASFSLGNSSGSIKVDPVAEHYILNWDVGEFGVVAGSNYRINVRVGDFVLGYADVFVVKNASQSVGQGLIKVVINRTVPVKFRIEKGIAASMTIDPMEATIDKGSDLQFTAKVFDLSGNEIPGLPLIWSSSDEAVATVDQDGLATGESGGETTISATYNYLSAEASLTVEETDVPPPGKDVVVFNDFNIFDNNAIENSNNQTLIKNLVNFNSSGSRNLGTKVWFDCRSGSISSSPCSDSDIFSGLRNIVRAEGFALEDISSSPGTLINIDEEVKTLFLWLPNQAFTIAEINAIKLFASEGGRVIFVGEHVGFYGQGGINVENQFLLNLGAQLRNIGDAIDCGYNLLPPTSLRSNPIMNGLTDLTIACASVIVPGPNDFPLFYDTSNSLLLAGVAAIDTEPITELQNLRIMNSEVRTKTNKKATSTGF